MTGVLNPLHSKLIHDTRSQGTTRYGSAKRENRHKAGFQPASVGSANLCAARRDDRILCKTDRYARRIANERDEPWHAAKKQIARDYIPGGPLEWLPRIVEPQVQQLNSFGYHNISDVLDATPHAINWHSISGIGGVTAKQIDAILQAQRTGRASEVPRHDVPEGAPIELYVDYKYLNNVNCNFSQSWPECLQGREMILRMAERQVALQAIRRGGRDQSC